MIARYVVLHHRGIPEPHYDLMFDLGEGGPLATWRSPDWPIVQPTALTRLADHRREYLTYEGEVSGDRGTVDRIAEGSCELEIDERRWTVRWSAAEFPAVELRHQASDQWRATVNSV
jgi:hypothetical protein